MGLTKLEEILEDNLDYSYIDQIAVPSIKKCCEKYSEHVLLTNSYLITTEICVLRERVLELEDMLDTTHNCVDWGVAFWGDDSGQVLKEKIESLINKCKDNG